tara:strand:+ start:4442 stop:5455 length:1014 start_codon:yes stop_codon:yes gene_type:complete
MGEKNKNKKKKLVELVIDERAERFGVEAISLVEFPAIESDWVFFSKDNFLSLAKLDEEKKTLVGAVLIPGKEIPRYNQEEGEEYIVYFSEETIKKAQELFMSNLRNNNTTYEHRETLQGLSVVESWIKEDEKYDKSSQFGFQNMPLGTWFVKMKIDNNEVWEKVKNKEVKGFSIEGYFTDRLIEATMNKANFENLVDKISVVGALDGEPLFATKIEAEAYAKLFKNCEGYHEHKVEGVIRYMACTEHSEATEMYKKKKKKKRYTKEERLNDEDLLDRIRMIIAKDENEEYALMKEYITKQALAKYPFRQCIADMKKKYGKKSAAKICSAIKNGTVNR